MKAPRFTSILRSSLVASAMAIAAIASTQPASAQSEQLIGKVKIPFAFQVGDRQMPAGEYRIVHESGPLVLVQGPGNAAIFMLTHSTIRKHESERGSMVFDRYGNQTFLHQVWTAGSTQGYECSKSKAEKEALLAVNNTKPTTTELALNTTPTR